MQTCQQKALKSCYKLLVENLNLEGHPQILASLYQDDILSHEAFLKIQRLETPFKQNTELYLRLKRCDASKQPFTVFCDVLERHGYQFISDRLEETLTTMEVNQQLGGEVKRCVYCTLVDALYPDEVALSL